MLKTASRFTLGALLFTTVACGEVIYEDEGWEDYEEGDMLTLDANQAALRGRFGALDTLDRADSANGWVTPYSTQIEVRDSSLEEGNASAFTFIDVMDGLLQNAEPGTVYYSSFATNAAHSSLIDETGDSYVRIDGDTEIVENDDTNVMVCSDGTTTDGTDVSYDEPAEEVVLQVEVLDTIDRTVPVDELEGELPADAEIIEDAETGEQLVVTDTVEVVEVRVVALVLEYDAAGEATGKHHIVNTRFVMER